MDVSAAASTAVIRNVAIKAKDIHKMSSARCVFVLVVDETSFPIESIVAVSIIHSFIYFSLI